MSTAAQIVANRQNAQSSTGPSTPEGKSASSRNAATHGLSATSFALLPHEDPAAFNAHLESYRRTFAPSNDHETFLVDRMVQSRWKLARIQRLEAAILRQMIADGPADQSPEAVLATAMLKGNAKAYLSLQRYAAAAERSYYKANSELTKGRLPKPQTDPETLLRAVTSPLWPISQNEAKPEPPKPAHQPLTGPHHRNHLNAASARFFARL